MKRFLILFAMGPGAAFAHGAHPPVPDAVHSTSHVAPVLGGVVIVMAVLVALRQRFRS